jgi:putative tricarboxylic transport membrane protein
MWENLALGLQSVMHLNALVAIFFGVLWGVIGGMIPGINATIAMALLLPFTWSMDSHVAVMMLAGVYCGGEYGGSIPAILLGTPGTPPAACTVIDGYALHKQGKTGVALGTSLIASVFGGLCGAVALVIVAIPLARIAISFGPSEYFALAVLGLTLICSLGGKNVFKGILAGIFGIFIACIGFDPFAGIPRFTFGSYSLADGFQMISVMMGLFAVSELLIQAEEMKTEQAFVLKTKVDTRFPSWKQIKQFLPVSIFSSGLGIAIGALPGAGATVAAFVAYSEAKRWCKDGDTFGEGNIKGVAAPESANNAVTGGALVPLLALGIPGSNSTAIMLGALVIHNISPGPLLFQNSPEIPYGIFTSLFAANFFMLIIGYLAIKLAIKVTNISKPVLIACIMALVFTGAYAYSGEVFDIPVTLGFGVLGYIMKKYGLPHTSTVLGFVLGFIMEVNIRRAIIINHGSYFQSFFNSPLSSILLIIALVSVAVSLWQNLRKPEATDS